MTEKKKIDPELNRARVKASMKKRGTERLSIYLEQGTLERIADLGYKGSAFAKALIMEELDRLEKMKKIRTAREEDIIYNTIILKKGYSCLTDQEYKSFTKGDTICGAGTESVELMRWSIEDIKEANRVLAEHRCRYTHWNVWDIEEYALEYCLCDEDGTFIDGSDFDFAKEA